MNSYFLSELLLMLATMSTGIVYGIDVFFAIIGKKAASLSKDNSIADYLGHIHLIADKRMPVIGVISVLSTLLFTVTSLLRHTTIVFSGIALLLLLAHLALYLRITKPINSQMSAAAIQGIKPGNIRQLQQRWDSIITYRAVILAVAMLTLILAGGSI
ncbi:DUF1772 domain-containing protein [Mucilaginibacter sp. SP1R1]|uniref:DUF1772 domain-containing protein n=1 Tax=Mucilaginibacter sp. SP1R1 TaxID=2723091 RepID=UPI001611ECD3|nr:DUF1772 domain-containing protein [Mucilaginibacter sp. SP1R1]MBB6148942.1 hypothetical protein [Mucilaginibacter sp. SP1R1]